MNVTFILINNLIQKFDLGELDTLKKLENRFNKLILKKHNIRVLLKFLKIKKTATSCLQER